MKWGLIVVGVMLVAMLAYCKDFLIPYTWHQKMTLEVEVDGQIYTGSSVVKVSVGQSDPITQGLGYPLQFGARGEAAFVELPGNRYLFALLSGGPPDSGPKTNAVNIFAEHLPQRGIERFAVLSKSRLKQDIPLSHYPLLVTFMGITDPKTVQKVEPENLAATFGPRVSLKRITLEITDEPVTEGKIESVLEWLKTVGDGMLDGQRISSIYAKNRLANSLSRLDFKRR
ncbi:hypothetical protein [Nitrospira sp. M1]